MRRLFSLLIVVLLVFRGLLGDAMAMGGMAAQAPLHGPQAAATAHHAEHLAPVAGAAHAAHAPAHAADGASGEGCAQPDGAACTHAHGASCAACGICHSAVSLTALALGAPGAAAGVRPEALSTRFVSALALQAVKPPIS